jgi:hypothetical protein
MPLLSCITSLPLLYDISSLKSYIRFFFVYRLFLAILGSFGVGFRSGRFEMLEGGRDNPHQPGTSPSLGIEVSGGPRSLQLWVCAICVNKLVDPYKADVFVFLLALADYRQVPLRLV